jgi:L-lactate utilization protein LutC
VAAFAEPIQFQRNRLMASTYEKAYSAYAELAAKAAEGDPAARKDKVKAMAEVRGLERQAAREGVILSGGKKLGEARSKRSLQEEYINKFDNERPVKISEKETTMRAWHKQRLSA